MSEGKKTEMSYSACLFSRFFNVSFLNLHKYFMKLVIFSFCNWRNWELEKSVIRSKSHNLTRSQTQVYLCSIRAFSIYTILPSLGTEGNVKNVFSSLQCIGLARGKIWYLHSSCLVSLSSGTQSLFHALRYLPPQCSTSFRPSLALLQKAPGY